MRVAIASGKGGTGKTTIAVNLAKTLAEDGPVRFLDCDVEEPNAHLFLRPTFQERKGVALLVPQIDAEKCTGCGLCSRVCAFHALAVVGGKVITFPELCHGCGGCSLFCPTGAIHEIPKKIGVVENGLAGKISFSHGRLEVGSALVPPLIKAVKKQVHADRIVILDAPPGTSCPVVATVAGCDYCLLVTEPTPFGRHDLDLAVGMARELGIPCGVVLNRAGDGDEIIEDYCAREGLPLLLKIPFDRRYAACYAAGNLLVEEFPSWQEVFKDLWREIERRAGA
ncbi:MAG: hypothetical protein PWP65_1850 [Clostridia bacterium]|nr:hypothetical protein [Clostridia bacterium]